MLTPLSIDQRLLTLRQLIKRDLVSQYTGDAELDVYKRQGQSGIRFTQRGMMMTPFSVLSMN